MRDPNDRPLRRVRPVPLQVYLTRDEDAALREAAADGGCSASALIRSWIRQAKPRGAKTQQEKDPRQLSIEDFARALASGDPSPSS